MEGVPGPSSAVIEPRDLILCENCFLSYGDFCVLYSGKSDLLLAFAQRHGVILSEILGKRGCGGKAPQLKRGTVGGEDPS